MNISRRLLGIEKQAEEAIGDRCDACGFPDSNAAGALHRGQL